MKHIYSVLSNLRTTNANPASKSIMKFGPAFSSPRMAPEWVQSENHRTLNSIKMCGAALIKEGSAAADALRAANQIAMGR